MSRLPVVSSDGNAWGTILNDFLSQAHNADGSIKNLFYNVKDPAYGAKGDGVTDDTAAIAAARSAANAAGGGTVWYPAGTYLSGNQTLYTNVIDRGAGAGATVIMLKAGANTDLFSAQTSSINLSAAINTGIVGTLYNFGMYNLTLDGNLANQTSGPSYPLRFYGYKFTLSDVIIRQGYSGGMLSDWNGGQGITPTSDNMEGVLNNVTIHHTNGIGLQMGGPHDSQLINILSWANKYHNFHFAPNMVGSSLDNLHGYACTNGQGGVCCVCEAEDMIFLNPAFEGGDLGQFAALANKIQLVGARLFDAPASVSWGLKIGQAAGETPLIGQVLQSAGVTTAVAPSLGRFIGEIIECDGTHGSIWYDNDGGNTSIDATIYQTSGVKSTGTPAASTDYRYRGMASPISFTPTTIENPAFHAVPSGGVSVNGSPNSFIAFLVNPGNDGNHGVIIASNSASQSASLFDVQNSSFVSMLSVLANGNIVSLANLSVGQSATAVALAASGTIATANIGVSRVAPTGNVASIILASGTQAGQQVTVINESAFTVTFAASGTSHVADGVSAVILANRKMDFTWDSGTSLWYHS